MHVATCTHFEVTLETGASVCADKGGGGVIKDNETMPDDSMLKDSLGLISLEKGTLNKDGYK